MRLIPLYLTKDILKPATAGLLIMLSIIWLMQSLRFMDLIINKGLDVGTFLWITILLIPSLLIVILPLSGFAGTVYSFKRLQDDNELSALYAAGFTRAYLIAPALKLSLLFTLICYALTLWLIPAGTTAFKAMQYTLRQTSNNLLLEEGTFNALSDNLTIYIKHREADQSLYGLLVYDTRDTDHPVTWIAKEGRLTFSEKGEPRLALTQGIRQEVSPERTTVLEFAEHTVDMAKSFQEAAPHWRGREERYLSELTQTEGLSTSERNQFRAEYQKRLLWPLTPIPLTLLAAVFILKRYKTRGSLLKPTAHAVIAAILYQGGMMLLHNLSTKGNPWVLYGQWALPLLVSVACLWHLTDAARSAPRSLKELAL